MKTLWRLQQKTLMPAQLIGYSLSLLIGLTIILTSVQLYLDIQPVLASQEDVFKGNDLVISKPISLFKTLNKDGIYFNKRELKELEEQPFVESVSKFNTATFKIRASTKKGSNLPLFYTDLFFESLPDKSIDVSTKDWRFDPNQDLLPIIIPESYLKLYNFGFAESQGLPVISESMVSQVSFDISIYGRGRSKKFTGKIVGFSTKINSILVPESFLTWANQNYGDAKGAKASRLLISFKDGLDDSILEFFNQKNYSINEDKLALNKTTFFLKAAFYFVFAVALIIIVLSISSVVLSIKLIIHKNKELVLNLYHIGYHHQKISQFYQAVIGGLTLIVVIIACILSAISRSYYTQKIKQFFSVSFPDGNTWLFGFGLAVILIGLYYLLVARNIKKVVEPAKN